MTTFNGWKVTATCVKLYEEEGENKYLTIGKEYPVLDIIDKFFIEFIGDDGKIHTILDTRFTFKAE